MSTQAGIDFEAADNARDARLRYRVLRLLNECRSIARPGPWIKDILDSAAGKDRLEDEQHLVKLLIDLDNAGYVLVEDKRTRAREDLSLGFIYCSITAEGTRFVSGAAPPDPLIDDGRIVKRN